MAIRKWFGALVAGGLVGAIAAGCSSSNGGTPSDGGGDGAIHRTLDSGIGSGDDGNAGGGFDGTTGKACTTDADCVSATGPGINMCSSDFVFMTPDMQTVSPWATPVCIVPPSQSSVLGNCDPVPQGNDGFPHFCDGPDDATSPGLCVPFDASNPQQGQGTCYPLCTFALDGTKPKGCVGTDWCVPFTFLRSISTGTVTGYGFCAGGCQQDSDCAQLGAGSVCQTDIGYCTTAKVKRTKAVGAACSTGGAVDDTTSGACNCDSDFMTGDGFCSTTCVVGGLPCPGGWICDAGFPTSIVFMSSTGSSSVPVTAQNMGLPGVCQPPCTPADAGVVDAGAAVDSGEEAGADAAVTPIVLDGGSGGCPPNSTCQTTNVAGPDCVP